MLFDRAHREFFWLFVRRDLKVRYAGSTLGGLWNLIHPIMMIAIYMTIFSSIMRNKLGGIEPGTVDYGDFAYGVHLVAGLIPWLLFSDVLTRSTGVLQEHGPLLQNVSFPPIILFLTVLFNGLLVHVVAFVCFLGILVVAGLPVPVQTVGGLGVLAAIGLSGMGLGMMLASSNVFFRDTAQLLAVVMQLLFWFNPIVYPRTIIFSADALEGHPLLVEVGRWLIRLNPFERFIGASQRLMGLPMPWELGVSDWAILVGFPVVCVVAGTWLFRRTLPEIRDNI